MVSATSDSGRSLRSGALRILIVDGNALARRRIQDLLSAIEIAEIRALAPGS